ncbi:MAG TPA: prenyltransferase/squalene oxidase repeat-containing protein [Actinomycetota bacterium]|nr:prenyltransferase/squalene oxidase repeat-containing protein [Actinomycetota bacterium]
MGSRRPLLRIAIAVCCLTATVLQPVPAAASPGSEAAARGAGYLSARQQDSGAFFTPDHPADAVAEVVVALAAAGTSSDSRARALDYVESRGPERATKAAYAGRIVLGLVAAGRDPASFGGFDYAARLESSIDSSTGSYDRESLYGHALAVLALAAARRPVPEQALRYARDNRCASGGWSHRRACAAAPDADTTATMLAALLAAGLSRQDDAVSGGRGHLMRTQNPSGGWGLEVGKPTNANSTALVLSAVATLGEDPSDAPWQAPGGGDGVKALLSLQHPSGGFRYVAGEGPNDYATVQAVTGVSGAALPVRGTAGRDQAGGTGSGAAPGARASVAPAGGRKATASAAPGASPTAKAAGRNRAGLVLRDPDGRVRRLCLVFDEAEITGLDLLSRLAPDLVVESGQMGSAICRIGPHGCSKSDGCFCRYPEFWGYWTRDRGSGWTFSSQGAAARVVRDGSVDAWTWGRDGKPEPPDAGVEEVCSGGPGTPPAGRDAQPPPERRSAVAPVLFGGALAAVAAGLSARRLRIRRAGGHS